MFTYLLLDALVVLSPIPFIILLESRLHYLKNLKYLAIAIVLTSIPMLIWDSFFTKYGVWGFSEEYLTGIKILNLPIEEVLFFFTIPFSTIFIYSSAKYFFKINIPINVSRGFYMIVTSFTLIIAAMNPDKIYTFINLVIFSLVMILSLTHYKKSQLSNFFLMYVISIFPFLIVNGILTNGIDAISETPIVWYNQSEILGIRISGIPVEDFFYSATLLLSNITLCEYLKKRALKN